MRTVSAMIAKVRRLINDYAVNSDSRSFTDEDLRDSLVEAHRCVADEMMGNPRGRRLLRHYGDAEDLDEDTGVYAVPTGCLGVFEVQVPEGSTDWRSLPFADPARQRPDLCVRSGLAALEAPYAGGLLGWWNDCDYGNIRLWPTPAADVVGGYRLVYGRCPVWPEVADEATHTITGVPDGWDALCEYLSAALLLMEESENGKPVGAYGELYQNKMANYLSGIGDGMARPARSFIRPH